MLILLIISLLINITLIGVMIYSYYLNNIKPDGLFKVEFSIGSNEHSATLDFKIKQKIKNKIEIKILNVSNLNCTSIINKKIQIANIYNGWYDVNDKRITLFETEREKRIKEILS